MVKRTKGSQAHGTEWIAVRRKLPGWIMQGEPYRPDVVLVMDPESGLVMGVNAFSREDSPSTMASWIAQGLERVPTGAARPRLRIDDDELAPLVAQRLGASWDVVSAPTPEASEALASLASSLTQPPGAGGHFVDGATPAVVGRFFAAAAPLYRAAPWRVARDSQVLAVDAPAFGYENACLCIIGALGESLGVLIYRSMADYLQMVRIATRGRSIKGPGVLTFAMSFDPASEVPRRLRQEAKQEGWPVQGGGFPTIAHIDPDAVLRPLVDDDYAFAAAVLEALSRFIAEQGSVFARDEIATPVHVRHEDAGIEVSITAPHPGATWEWGDSPDAAALAGRKSRRPRGRGTAK